MEKKPDMQPLAPMDMHAPVEITIAVRMVLADGQVGRVLYDMQPGRIPSRAEIMEAVKPALDVDLLRALPMQGNPRPMNKPEFVAFITTRAAGAPVPMEGDQHFVPVPCDIPHAMLVHAICGVALKSQFVDEYTERGLRVYIGDRHDTRWDRAALEQQPDDVLLAIYRRIAA